MTEWYQQSLTPPEVVECKILIGLIPSSQHAQAMVELSDPTTKILTAQWSSPHVHSDNWMELVETATRKAVQFLADNVEPF